MNRIFAGAFACVLAVSATSALAQSKPPLKLGGILDMSGLYADITGPGSEAAAKMAVEDFGGEVLGRKVEIVVADHLNKADNAHGAARAALSRQPVATAHASAARSVVRIRSTRCGVFL